MEHAAPSPIQTAETLRRLREWDITGIGLHPGGSNYVYVVRLEGPEQGQLEAAGKDDRPEGTFYGIYKPASGERPLRDFPYGTLHQRERAAYLLSVELGWPNIPPTVVRDGPHGEGSVQLFIDADPSANYFTMRDECLPLFEPVAMFDVLAHNADRKGGSCLKPVDNGRIWAIDHGLTFNEMARRRTVMFEFNGRPYQERMMEDVRRVVALLEAGKSPFSEEMRSLISPHEVESLAERGRRMLETGYFPALDPNINVPWPFV
jgi:hypothetical protein